MGWSMQNVSETGWFVQKGWFVPNKGLLSFNLAFGPGVVSHHLRTLSWYLWVAAALLHSLKGNCRVARHFKTQAESKQQQIEKTTKPIS